MSKFIPITYPESITSFQSSDLDNFLEWCVKQEVSDITFQNEERILCEIHGKKHFVTSKRLTKSEVAHLIKSMHSAGADSVLNSGEELDTAFVSKIDKNRQYRFRMNAKSILTHNDKGFSITLRYINNFAPKLETLNLREDVLDCFYRKNGIVIVSGPTGSGKSTLLASIIQHRLAEEDAHIKISTFESPIEFTYDHIEKKTSSISQCEIGTHMPSFVRGVRNSLRTRSDIVLIGESRDYATSKAMINASMVGPLVYTTCHTNNVAEIPARLINDFPENEKEAEFVNLIDNLELLLTQKLVPSVDGKRVAIREFLILTQEMKDLLIEGGLNRVTINLRKMVKQYGQTFLQDLTEKLISGKITEEEFYITKKQLK